ncbi:TPA: hypothetical protein ACNOH7_000442 [Vibrio fluvialis]|nr:hypothetical protein [Vibrio fluvialis]
MSKEPMDRDELIYFWVFLLAMLGMLIGFPLITFIIFGLEQ